MRQPHAEPGHRIVAERLATSSIAVTFACGRTRALPPRPRSRRPRVQFQTGRKRTAQRECAAHRLAPRRPLSLRAPRGRPEFGRRVGIGDVAADRATVADGGVGDQGSPRRSAEPLPQPMVRRRSRRAWQSADPEALRVRVMPFRQQCVKCRSGPWARTGERPARRAESVHRRQRAPPDRPPPQRPEFIERRRPRIGERRPFHACPPRRPLMRQAAQRLLTITKNDRLINTRLHLRIFCAKAEEGESMDSKPSGPRRLSPEARREMIVAEAVRYFAEVASPPNAGSGPAGGRHPAPALQVFRHQGGPHGGRLRARLSRSSRSGLAGPSGRRDAAAQLSPQRLLPCLYARDLHLRVECASSCSPACRARS